MGLLIVIFLLLFLLRFFLPFSHAVVQGLTVVTVVHQPRFEALSLCDDVILLGKGGRVAFSAPLSSMVLHFQSLGFPCPSFANPADFVVDVISGRVSKATEAAEELSLSLSVATASANAALLSLSSEQSAAKKLRPPIQRSCAEKGQTTGLKGGKGRRSRSREKIDITDIKTVFRAWEAVMEGESSGQNGERACLS